jgi:hypothetical protein
MPVTFQNLKVLGLCMVDSMVMTFHFNIPAFIGLEYLFTDFLT